MRGMLSLAPSVIQPKTAVGNAARDQQVGFHSRRTSKHRYDRCDEDVEPGLANAQRQRRQGTHIFLRWALLGR